jgi:transcriptional regulator with XRE-family HTH domain
MAPNAKRRFLSHSSRRTRTGKIAGGQASRVAEKVLATSGAKQAAPQKISGSPAVPQAAQRTDFLIESLGSGAEVARLLGVNRSQPAQWRNGRENPGPAVAQRLVDLDYILAKALQIWPRRAAIDWLNGPNNYLDGARPIDVLQARGAAEVVEALEVAMA